MLIDYNMSADYCSDWTAIDAIREMVQNAIDSGKNYKCEITRSHILVTTYDKVLPLNTLMLGHSVKNSSDSIGKYGEGYKIGMLVLTREALNPHICTSGNLINGVFLNNQFDIPTFNLSIEEYMPSNDICFICEIGDIDIDELKSKIPAFTGTIPDLPTTVDIWQDRPGELFVNGLFVSKSNLVFGYNFAPSHIELNRDRNMANGVHWQLAAYYASLDVKHAELIFTLIERDAPDVQDLSYRLHNDKLKAELTRLFFNKYGDGAKIAKPGTSYFGGFGSVSCSTSSARLYSKCGIEEAKKTTDPESPDQILTTWLANNKRHLRRDVRNRLQTVITRSKGWRKADIH